MNRFIKDKKVLFTLAFIAVTAILITVLGIAFRQKVLNMIPLYVSLIVGILLSRANRFAPLLGGLNSILYSIVYFSFTLYANAIYALVVSAPLQIITFMTWSHRKSGSTTLFRKMSARVRLSVLAGIAAAWVGCYFILSLFGSDYMLLDNTLALVGILTNVLMMFSFVEYAPLSLLSNLISVALYLQMVRDDPAQLTYLVYTLYLTICNIMALFSVKQHYIAQTESNKS